MKSASAAMIALLNSGQELYRADCYTLTLKDGTVARYTSADRDIIVGADTFVCTGPQFNRKTVKSAIGLEVDSLELEVYANTSDLLAGVPFLEACRRGALDQATLRLDYALMVVFGNTSPGVILQFQGIVAPLVAGRSMVKITVNSPVEKLDIQMPRELYQPTCIHTLYDGGCGLSRAAFLVATSAAAGTTRSSLVTTLTNPANYFALGYITGTSGANLNITRSVRTYSGGVFQLSLPLPFLPGVGDGFNAFPGCDKLLATCDLKFANKVRFLGMPFVPVPETAA